MNLLDNIDKELEKIKEVKESLKLFKKFKIPKLQQTILVKRARQEKKRNKQDDKDFSSRMFRKKPRKYRRCPKKYEVYINSHWWEKRKSKYYQNHERICAACRSVNFITLHHMIYGDLGNEKDEHLIPLCRRCHQEYHLLNGTQSNMLETTFLFVKNKQLSPLPSNTV